MGRGDRKSRRGKIFRHSYGNRRPRPRKKKDSEVRGEVTASRAR
ncbi:MAG: 30S ribosomal protein THX [bacterium]